MQGKSREEAERIVHLSKEQRETRQQQRGNNARNRDRRLGNTSDWLLPISASVMHLDARIEVLGKRRPAASQIVVRHCHFPVLHFAKPCDPVPSGERVEHQ